MVNAEKANLLMYKLESIYNFGFIAFSLGYYENLISAYDSSNNIAMNPEIIKRIGIVSGLIRCSIEYLGTFKIV
jgi:methionine-gamma-lyase